MLVILVFRIDNDADDIDNMLVILVLSINIDADDIDNMLVILVFDIDIAVGDIGGRRVRPPQRARDWGVGSLAVL